MAIPDDELIPYYDQTYKPHDVTLTAIDPKPKQQIDPYQCIEILTNAEKGLKADYLNYLLSEHGTVNPKEEDRLIYMEVANFCYYIIRNLKNQKTEWFYELFHRIEGILNNCDKETKDLLTVGFFEDLQGRCLDHDIDQYHGFDQWLGKQYEKSLGND
jgi:hypothetical protein